MNITTIDLIWLALGRGGIFVRILRISFTCVRTSVNSTKTCKQHFGVCACGFEMRVIHCCLFDKGVYGTYPQTLDNQTYQHKRVPQLQRINTAVKIIRV